MLTVYWFRVDGVDTTPSTEVPLKMRASLRLRRAQSCYDLGALVGVRMIPPVLWACFSSRKSSLFRLSCIEASRRSRSRNRGLTPSRRCKPELVRNVGAFTGTGSPAVAPPSPRRVRVPSTPRRPMPAGENVPVGSGVKSSNSHYRRSPVFPTGVRVALNFTQKEEEVGEQEKVPLSVSRASASWCSDMPPCRIQMLSAPINSALYR